MIGNRSRFGFRTTFALFLSVSLGPSLLAAQDDTLQWLDDYDDAIAEARRTGKPLFLEFRCAP